MTRALSRLLLTAFLVIGISAITGCGDDGDSSNQSNNTDTGLISDTGGQDVGGQDAGDQDTAGDTDPSGDADPSGDVSDTSQDTTDSSDTPASDFCDQMLDTMLSKFEECVGGPKDVWEAFLSESQDTCGVLTAGVEAGRITYDASETQKCLDAIDGLACDTFGNSDIPSACQAALEGQVAAGDTCYEDMECAGESYCTSTTKQCPGQCEPKIAEGGSCSSNTECQGSLECNSTCEQPDNTDTLPGLGEDCPNYRCQTGLTCNSQTSKCEEYDREGEACTQGEKSCETFTYCGSSNTCERYRDLGAQCGQTDAGEWAGCLPGTYCDFLSQTSGTCEASKVAGESCSSGMECKSLACSETDVCLAICAPPAN